MSLRGSTFSADEAIPMNKQFYIYLMTNQSNEVIYTGVTGNLKRRVYEHRNRLVDGFTKRYNITKLVYYEVFSTSRDAIIREKQIKAGSRKKKDDLVNLMNQKWDDLYDQL